jgi:hypothetical protein
MGWTKNPVSEQFFQDQAERNRNTRQPQLQNNKVNITIDNSNFSSPITKKGYNFYLNMLIFIDGGFNLPQIRTIFREKGANKPSTPQSAQVMKFNPKRASFTKGFCLNYEIKLWLRYCNCE